MPSHPLRRISTGSLSSLARSTDRTHAPSDLDFLEPAITELVDEAATLASNVQRLNALHEALGTFNEGFSAYMYAIKMNAFSMAWPEAPIAASWQRVPELAPAEPEPSARLTTQALSNSEADSRPGSAHGHAHAHAHAGDTTYATVYSDGESPAPTPAPKRRAGVPVAGADAGAKKKPATGLRKPAPVTAAARRALVAAKKRRELEISQIIDTQLPLEYRGGDADARLCMEKVIERLWEGDGLAIGDMVKPPEMPHPKVNKCLIALVAKKLVGKSSAKGKTLYTWAGQY